jgi:regulator of sirC expression with transglutaminase-like and TPR domain
LVRWGLLALFPALLCASYAAFAGAAAEPQAEAKPASASDDPLAELVRKVREKPDDFSYAKISILVAREIYPDLSEEKAGAIQKEWIEAATKLKEKTQELAAIERIARLSDLIYKDRGVKTPAEMTPEKENPDHYFPHAVWEKKQGVCLGFSTLYLVLGENAGFPMRPVHAPQHIYLQYGEGKDALSIETTNGGRVFTLEAYMARMRFPDETMERLKRTYFKPLGRLDVLGDLLNAASWCSAIRTAAKPLSPARALLAAELCVEIGPDDYNNLDTLAEALIYAGQPKKALEALNKALKMRPPSIGPYDEGYWEKRLKRMREAAEDAEK